MYCSLFNRPRPYSKSLHIMQIPVSEIEILQNERAADVLRALIQSWKLEGIHLNYITCYLYGAAKATWRFILDEWIMILWKVKAYKIITLKYNKRTKFFLSSVKKTTVPSLYKLFYLYFSQFFQIPFYYLFYIV